jgi:indole-3-acetate monooxygenase
MSQLIDRAQGLVPSLREQRARIEAARRVPADVAGTLAEAGMFRMLLPRDLGGLEVAPHTFVEVLSILAAGDAASGWHVMTGATTTLLSAYLPVEAAKTIWAEPTTITAGVFAPLGRATPSDGGYRLSGRWPFFSGCDNASWCMGGALVMDGQAPRRLESGSAEIRSLFFPADRAERHDTWNTTGLRGTGSHDLEVSDLFVPAEHTTCVLVDAPRHSGALYRFPIFGLLAAGIAAVGLGIARACIDDFVELTTRRRRLAERELVQLELAKAEGELRAGTALLRSTCDNIAKHAEAGELPVTDRAALRLAATQASRCAVRAVDAMYHAGGGAALYAESPLQRHFRDVHTLTQHIMVAPTSLRTVGRVLLDIETDVSQL